MLSAKFNGTFGLRVMQTECKGVFRMEKGSFSVEQDGSKSVVIPIQDSDISCVGRMFMSLHTLSWTI